MFLLAEPNVQFPNENDIIIPSCSSVDMQLTGFKEEEGQSHEQQAGRRCREEVQSGGRCREGVPQGCLWGAAMMRCSEEV